MTTRLQSPDPVPSGPSPGAPAGTQNAAAQPPPQAPGGHEVSRGDAKVFLEQWKAVIDVQMHFNEIILRMRTTGVSVVIAVYGAAALSIAQFPWKFLDVFGYRVHPSAAILAFGLLLLVSILAVDYFYYYRLLVASVEMGERLDRQMEGRTFSGVPLLGLTTLISTKVTRCHAGLTLLVFYGLPLVVGIVAMWYVLSHHAGDGMFF